MLKTTFNWFERLKFLLASKLLKLHILNSYALSSVLVSVLLSKK